VAAALPADTAAAVWSATAPLRARFPDARWSPVEKLHLTLVFLGATDASRVDGVLAAVARASAGYGPFEVRTGAGGGYARGRRGGVAWLRLAVGAQQVIRLSRAVDDAIGSSIYAQADPHPHLTLARRVDEPLLAELRRAAPALERSWTVNRVVLFRSFTDPGGSRYEELHSVELRA
jgi:RNA 2',3'-cyclic 3'-phosphodiesterase